MKCIYRIRIVIKCISDFIKINFEGLLSILSYFIVTTMTHH